MVVNGLPHSTPHPSGDLRAGVLLGRYRLLSLVASGGMAQIWAAKPESGGFSRTVALKVIRPEHAADEEYRRMLIDEAAAAAAVHHPNVCEIFELGQSGHVVFIAMEWVPGDSIAGLIRQRTQYVPFSYALAARVVADACAGLHAAHTAVAPDGKPMNIIHRDISPQNILLSSQGHVKVSDFGIAKARDQIHSQTRTGEIKGKFAYIAPEQILGRAVDLRSDIYAMGCVLFVATLGLRPFGRGTHEVLTKIARGEFKAPIEIVESYPQQLNKIVVCALAKDPSERFQTAEEMRLALEDWLARSGKIVTHTDIARAVAERLSPTAREQIQALRSANQFTPISVAARIIEDDSNSWELPTAVSGLIQVRASLAAAPGPANQMPTRRPGGPRRARGGDTKRSITVEDIGDAEEAAPSTPHQPPPSSEATPISVDVEPIEQALRAARTGRSAAVLSPPRPRQPLGDLAQGTGRESFQAAAQAMRSGRTSLKRVAWALGLGLLLVLAFLAGRL